MAQLQKELQRWLLQVNRQRHDFAENAGAIVVLLVLPLAVALIPLLLSALSPSPSQMSISALAREIRAGRVESIIVAGATIAVTEQAGVERTVHFQGDMLDSLSRLGVTAEELDQVEIKGRSPTWVDGIGSAFFRAVAVFLLAVLYLFVRQMTSVANPAALVSTKPGRRVSFRDVAGLAEAKEDLGEVVGFLRDPRPFAALGAKVPRGVLLVGPPGNGKTLLARAVAGEAEVEFLAASGSDFVEVYVGRGAARLRSLFKRARRRAPCVVFIDELDSLGRHRGSAHSENDHALNQLLVEMDGFSSDERVAVVAATNRADMLDAALLRPGRFDRRVTVPSPDIRTRQAILELHAREKPLASDVDLARIAAMTAGLSGADLANVMNEAAILAVRHGQPAITQAGLSEGIDRTLVGSSRSGELVDERERRVFAYHEAGHALSAHLLGDEEIVQKVSIVARGPAGGFTRLAGTEDVHLWSRKRCASALVWLLGGRAAEEIVFDDVTTGAQDDLRRTSALARAMVASYGMSDRVGPLAVETASANAPGGSPARALDIGPRLAELIDEEVQSLVRGAEQQAKGLLTQHRDRLDALAQALLAEETLEGERLRELLT